MGHSGGIWRAYRNWTGCEEGETVLSKIVHFGEKRPNSEPKLCKHSFSLRKKFKTKMSDRDKHNIIAKNNILPQSIQKASKLSYAAESRGE